MATAKTVSTPRGQNRRRWPWVLLALAVLLALFLAIKGPGLLGEVRAGSGYNAVVVCMCRYQGNRSLESCRDDMQNVASLIQVSEDAEAKTIRAGVPLVTSAAARYDPAFGCVLE
jgi:hypothetical protein